MIDKEQRLSAMILLFFMIAFTLLITLILQVRENKSIRLENEIKEELYEKYISYTGMNDSEDFEKWLLENHKEWYIENYYIIWGK